MNSTSVLKRKNKKIVAFGYVNLSDHWAELFYFDELIKNGYDVVYLNVDKITLNQYSEIINYSSEIEQKTISTLGMFEQIIIEEINEAIIIPCVTITNCVWPLFKVLLQHKANVYYIHVGELPTTEKIINRENFVRKLTILFSLALLERFIFNYHKKLFCNNLRGAFAAGEIAKRIQQKNGCKNVIEINVRDYDDTLINRSINKKDSTHSNYYLFLDGYLPYHPDNAPLGLIIQPELYFNSMNRFFSLIEKKHGVEIIIAPHPKAEYETIGNKFGGRKIIKKSTRKLIEYCDLVLLHESSALSYAICYQKEMWFLANNDIADNTGWYSDRIKHLAELLGAVYLNVDKYAEVGSRMPTPNACNMKLKYDEYKYKYLTSKKCEETKSGEIILNEFTN
jgi:hypothetical protein